jgi:pimeloyl-ACP methyl ester carboxylesterase
MSEIQATEFAASWTVTSQYTDPSTGLSATVFQENATGQKYLAIRGTEPSNWFQDIIINDGVIAVGYLPDALPQYNALKAQMSIWLGDGTLSNNFTVSGHSLGGYLATALTADFSTHITKTYLYNAPGLNGVLGGATAAILDAFGVTAPIDASKVVNIKADAGISPIAGLGAQVAPTTLVNIENQLFGVSNPPGAFNHSQQVLTDSLALYQTFALLDENISISSITNVFKSASNNNELTLESLLDGLRRMILSGSIVETQEGNREKLWEHLQTLQNSGSYQSLIGKVTITNPTHHSQRSPHRPRCIPKPVLPHPI